MIAFLLLLGGLALVVGGGESLVRGAAALARRFGVPPVVIGMTVVAFGTSTPELVVNLTAVWAGDTAIGFGNVVGSNIANIGLLLGVVALYRPLAVHPSIVTRETPMLLLASAVALALAVDPWLDGGDAQIARTDGLVMLMLFGVFLYYTVMDVIRTRRVGDPFLAEAEHPPGPTVQPKLGRATLLIVVGLALLIVGGRLTVSGASDLARAMGVPEVVIGLTLVAVGTSLPELATSLVAARRGESDLAVGNIVGSNIYNLLFILGTTAALHPVDVPAGGAVDVIVMTGFALLLFPLAVTQRKITRGEGALLLAVYAGYIAWLAMR